MKIKILLLSIISLLIASLTSCVNMPSINRTETKVKEHTITIINTIDNSKEEIIFSSFYFSLNDLPTYSDNDYYFLGYSFDIDGDLLQKNYAYPIESDINLYANFGIRKDSFDIDTIPTIYIEADDTITSKETYVTAKIEIIGEDYALEETNFKIRLRGNSSLGVPKKSYKLKFDEKIDIFSFGKDKEWALIANYFDPSHLRNFYAYKLAKTMGMEYSIDCRFVNVYLNGLDQGLYLFCETVKTSSNRVDIEDGYNPNSEEIPFLLELDYKLEENNPNYIEEQLDIEFFFLDNTEYNGKRYQFATKYPKTFTTDDITLEQYTYIKDYMNNVYRSVRDGDYENYIDVDSFIDYFIIQELFLNIDQDYSSVYMYKPYGEKLYMGPAWDFDLSTGNCSYVGTYDPFRSMKDVNGGNYLFVTLMNHPEFKEKFQTRLRELDKYIIPTMLSSFTNNLKTIEQYANKDNEIWQNLNEPNWARPEWLLNKTYTQQVNYLNNFLDQHYYWMINNM